MLDPCDLALVLIVRDSRGPAVALKIRPPAQVGLGGGHVPARDAPQRRVVIPIASNRRASSECDAGHIAWYARSRPSVHDPAMNGNGSPEPCSREVLTWPTAYESYPEK